MRGIDKVKDKVPSKMESEDEPAPKGKYTTEKAQKELGLQFRSSEETIKDTVQSLIDNGFV